MLESCIWIVLNVTRINLLLLSETAVDLMQWVAVLIGLIAIGQSVDSWVLEFI